MAICSNIKHHQLPKLYLSNKAASFFEQCLKLDPQRVIGQFEAWVVNNMEVGMCIVTVHSTNQHADTLLLCQLPHQIQQSAVMHKIYQNAVS